MNIKAYQRTIDPERAVSIRDCLRAVALEVGTEGNFLRFSKLAVDRDLYLCLSFAQFPGGRSTTRTLRVVHYAYFFWEATHTPMH